MASGPPNAARRDARVRLSATERSRASALLVARLVLGLIFFMAGVYKVFRLMPAGHVERWFLPYRGTFLPEWSLWAVGWTIPFVELGAGGLLLLGLRIRAALYAVGVVLVVVVLDDALCQQTCRIGDVSGVGPANEGDGDLGRRPRFRGTSRLQGREVAGQLADLLS